MIQGFSALHYPNVPAENKNSNQTLTSKFGLDSFVLFKQKKWRYFLFCHVTWGGFANN
jgi:NHS family xanthosine MFS transporter